MTFLGARLAAAGARIGGAEWSGCDALQQRARAVSLATLTLALTEVSPGASRQVGIL